MRSEQQAESIHTYGSVSEITLKRSELNVSVQTLQNSIKPSITEIERFIFYLNTRFNLGIASDLIVNIEKTTPNKMGFFSPKESPTHYAKQDAEQSQIKPEPLNLIVLSSLYLKTEPYNTIAHELAHYINHIQGHPAKNNYHHKHFKAVAEKMLLSVEKGKHGYNITNNTPEFLALIEDFKPNKDAFKIFQHITNKKAKPSRNLLFMCNCGVKVRTAKNEDKPFNAICLYCDSPFREQTPENEENEDD